MTSAQSANIFVSSTCKDLVDLRHELSDHIRSLGLFPILSDDPESAFVVSGNADTVDTCLVNIRTCGALILVLNRRYGWVPPGRDVSVTHLEYREAVAHHIPVLFYVRSDLLAWSEQAVHTPLPGIESADVTGLRSLITERRDQTGGSSSNWLRSFQTSVDLKRLISRDLQREAADGILDSLSKAGTLPQFAVLPGGGTIREWRLPLVNISRADAYDIEWRIGVESPTHSKAVIHATESWETTWNFESHFSRDQVAAIGDHEVWSSIRFTTADRSRIEEVFACRWTGTPSRFSKIGRRVLHREPWSRQYETSTVHGIKLLTNTRLTPDQ